jgi:DNA-binding response OmpR family regulator
MLCQIFLEKEWKLAEVAGIQEAFRWIERRGPPPIVICERLLADGDWKDLLTYIESLPKRPQLIVSSRLADEQLWSEVLNLLGDDVLATPFHPREVIHVVTCAWESWSRQWHEVDVQAAPGRCGCLKAPSHSRANSSLSNLRSGKATS